MTQAGHYVAVFGGAVSGAEAVNQLTKRGIRTVVFEQNALPFGKIEDGLPKWHEKLRDKEEDRINTKLSHPLVSYVPNTGLGKEVDFGKVAREWGFSAVLLATGAWRDRPLPVDGIDDYLGKGFYYQNPYIYWFNHYHEPGYSGPVYEVEDNAIIVGGGLASIDVAKVLMIENVEKALKERGHDVNMFTLERSIAKTLDKLGLTLEDLGIKGCTLYYRRRVIDMPLSPFDPDTPEKLLKAQKVREKILGNAQRKFLFHVKPLHVPVDKIVKDGRLAGLVFQETKIENGRARAVEGTEKEVLSPLVISSIGSLPEQINGVPMNGSVYKVIEEECCRIDGFDHVFALGNAVTGRGNINESLKHGREVSSAIIANYLEPNAELFENSVRSREEAIATQMAPISANIQQKAPLSAEQIDELQAKIHQLQAKVGYEGDYQKWIQTHTPVRLEDMLNLH